MSGSTYAGAALPARYEASGARHDVGTNGVTTVCTGNAFGAIVVRSDGKVIAGGDGIMRFWP